MFFGRSIFFQSSAKILILQQALRFDYSLLGSHMGFSCGIVGLPNVGKSTLFNALTAVGVAAENYPFCTIEPNIGIVPIPDKRLYRLGEIYKPEKLTPTTLEFVDIAGLVKGASKGEGLGNQFLSHIRNVDAIIHIVRCFEDENIVHVDGDVNPRRDIEIVEMEILLKDLETVDRKYHEAEKKGRVGDKKAVTDSEFYKRVHDHLSTGRLARYFHVRNEEESHLINELHLLTRKPVMYVCNVAEDDVVVENDFVRQTKEIASKEGAEVVTISAAIEAEIAELPANERNAFLKGLGLDRSGLERVIHAGYALLNLITFFTFAPREGHAWTIQQGTRAQTAAGKVHTDFEQGFIRAEVISYNDIDRLGSESAVKEAGLLRIEGKDYIVRDGDILFIRSNI